jgi:hypothetical protein
MTVEPPTTYDMESRHIARLADEIEALLDSRRANFSHGAAAQLMALLQTLATIERVAEVVPAYAALYKKLPFAAMQQAAMQSLAIIDEYLRHSAVELKQ